MNFGLRAHTLQNLLQLMQASAPVGIQDLEAKIPVEIDGNKMPMYITARVPNRDSGIIHLVLEKEEL